MDGGSIPPRATMEWVERDSEWHRSQAGSLIHCPDGRWWWWPLEGRSSIEARTLYAGGPWATLADAKKQIDALHTRGR